MTCIYERRPPFQPAADKHDFIVRAELTGLKPNTTYHFRAVYGVAATTAQAGLNCSFKTLAGGAIDTQVRFIVGSCMNYNKFLHGKLGKASGPLKTTLKASDAKWKILISPTPMVGPDDFKKIDNHADLSGFRHEADAFFAWLKENKINQFVVICGDRHWQYHSIHPSGVEEFACGALNDENARLGVAPGDKNGSDPQSLIRQLYTSPTPNCGFLQVTAGNELVIEHFNSRGERLYRAVK